MASGGKGGFSEPLTLLAFSLRTERESTPPHASGVLRLAHTQASTQLSCVAVLVLGGRAPELGSHASQEWSLPWLSGRTILSPDFLLWKEQ